MRSAFAFLVLGLVVVSPALAQERLEAFVSDRDGNLAMAELDVSVSGFGRVRTISPFRPDPSVRNRIDQVVALAGGRYLVWLNFGTSGADGQSMSVFDRRTRTVNHLGIVNGRQILADPLRPRVFLRGFLGDVSVIDAVTQASRTIVPWALGVTLGSPVWYAPRADVLAVMTTTTSGSGSTTTFTYAVRLVDVASGSTVGTVSLPNAADQIVLSDDARVLYVFGQSLTCVGNPFSCNSTQPILAFDTETGLEVGRTPPLPFATYVPLIVDDDRGYVFVQLSGMGRLLVFAPRTLAPVADMPVASTSEWFWVLKGRGMTLGYIARWLRDGAGCMQLAIDAYDLTARKRETFDVDAGIGGCRSYSLGPIVRPPLAPTNARATVTGQRVEVAWTDPGDATGFQLVVGVSPGTTAVSIPTGPDASVAFDGVPSGVYYVRVRASNEVGRSPESGEVRIVVP